MLKRREKRPEGAAGLGGGFGRMDLDDEACGRKPTMGGGGSGMFDRGEGVGMPCRDDLCDVERMDPFGRDGTRVRGVVEIGEVDARELRLIWEVDLGEDEKASDAAFPAPPEMLYESLSTSRIGSRSDDL